MVNFCVRKNNMEFSYRRVLHCGRVLPLLIILMLSLGEVASGQSVEADTETAPMAPEQLRSFSQEKIDTYLNDSDFDYPDRQKPSINLWSRFWRWFWSLFPEISIDTNFGPIVRIGFYILCGIVIIYTVLRLLGIDASQVLGRKTASQVQYAGDIEDIHGIDFEQEISKATGQQDYRQAIRWCYLWALKKLSDQQHIDWHPGKTNHDYLAELESPTLRQRLSYLVYLYEYTWYGDFPADEGLYQDARQRIDRLNEPQPA